jgi:hypothetical protein
LNEVRIEEYERNLAAVERWFRPTGTPALIAKCERLARLRLKPIAFERRARESGGDETQTGPLDATTIIDR